MKELDNMSAYVVNLDKAIECLIDLAQKEKESAGEQLPPWLRNSAKGEGSQRSRAQGKAPAWMNK